MGQRSSPEGKATHGWDSPCGLVTLQHRARRYRVARDETIRIVVARHPRVAVLVVLELSAGTQGHPRRDSTIIRASEVAERPSESPRMATKWQPFSRSREASRIRYQDRCSRSKLICASAQPKEPLWSSGRPCCRERGPVPAFLLPQSLVEFSRAVPV